MKAGASLLEMKLPAVVFVITESFISCGEKGRKQRADYKQRRS